MLIGAGVQGHGEGAVSLEYLCSSNADWSICVAANKSDMAISTWNTYAAAMLIGAGCASNHTVWLVSLEYLCSSNADWSNRKGLEILKKVDLEYLCSSNADWS